MPGVLIRRPAELISSRGGLSQQRQPQQCRLERQLLVIVAQYGQPEQRVERKLQFRQCQQEQQQPLQRAICSSRLRIHQAFSPLLPPNCFLTFIVLIRMPAGISTVNHINSFSSRIARRNSFACGTKYCLENIIPGVPIASSSTIPRCVRCSLRSFATGLYTTCFTTILHLRHPSRFYNNPSQFGMPSDCNATDSVMFSA